MKVIAIGNITAPLSDEQKASVMPGEVPATLKLYLAGKIEQFFQRQDKPGVVFLLNVDSVKEAEDTINALPLVTQGFAKYEFWPVGPLMPLGLLMQGKSA